jgi:transcriptional regulator with XRE-family HTH domain
MLTTGPQLRGARAMARLDRTELAEAAGVAINTVRRIEAMRGRITATTTTVDALRRALEARGVVFVEHGGLPGVCMAPASQR